MTAQKVVVYTKKHCPYCEAAKRLLAEKKVQFQEINIEGNEKLREEVAAKSGQQTVPQIFVNEKPLGGFQDISELDQRGELDKILGIK